MSEIYSTSDEYVDIHGRKLPVLIKSDGTVFIPLSEIRKTGFHVFTKTEFLKSRVEKSMVLDELRFYLLGAAREFLIQKDVNLINGEEINRSIEECREKITKNDPPSQNHTASSGVLGRTLLCNPAELTKSTRLLPQATPTQQGLFNNIGNSNQNRKGYQRLSDPVNSLRMPHQNENAKQAEEDFDDSSKNQMNTSHKKKFFNHTDKNDQSRNYQNNNAGTGKNVQRTNSESRSNSENEEGIHYIKLSNLNLKRIELLADLQDIKVVYIDSQNSEKLKFWVQLVENDSIVMDIMEKCMEIGDECPVVQPKLNTIYLAQHKEDLLWCRVIVTRVTPVIKVHFLDFGNDAVVPEVRSIPDDLSSIPAQAVRIVVSKPESSSQVILKMDQILTVKKVKQFLDTTYVVQICDKKRTSLPPQAQRSSGPILMNEIKYSTKLVDKDTVKIVAYSDGKLYLRNKEHHSKLVEVDLEIRDTPKQAVNDVVPGQLVFTKKVGCEEKLCRAVVKKIENNIVTVHFVDYHKEEKVPVKNLFGGNETIAKMLVTLIETPLKGYSISKFDANAATMLEEMILNNVKFTVVRNGSEFDLIHKDKSLPEMLFPCNSRMPSNDESNESHSSYVKVMFDEMACYEAPMGKGDYLLTNYKDPTEFTVVSTNAKESDLLTQCTGIEVNDKEPYEPEESEMILAHFEGAWYRALVLEKFDDETYQVLFVEYGNMANLTKKDIRRFPKEFKEIPLLGLVCQLKVKITNAVKNRLEQLLTPDNIYEIDILSYSIENLIYTVDIPKITSILKQEELI